MAADRTIHARLRTARAVMVHPHKSNDVDAGRGKRYRFAPLSSVIDIIFPACANNGLIVTQDACTTVMGGEWEEKEGKYGTRREWIAFGTVDVTTVVRSDYGEALTFGPYSIPWFGGAQDAGIATTYARRYALLTTFGLYGEDDADGLTLAEISEAQVAHRERRQRPQAGPSEPDALTQALRAAGCKSKSDADAVCAYALGDRSAGVPSDPQARRELSVAVAEEANRRPPGDLLAYARVWLAEGA